MTLDPDHFQPFYEKPDDEELVRFLKKIADNPLPTLNPVPPFIEWVKKEPEPVPPMLARCINAVTPGLKLLCEAKDAGLEVKLWGDAIHVHGPPEPSVEDRLIGALPFIQAALVVVGIRTTLDRVTFNHGMVGIN